MSVNTKVNEIYSSGPRGGSYLWFQSAMNSKNARVLVSATAKYPSNLLKEGCLCHSIWVTRERWKIKLMGKLWNDCQYLHLLTFVFNLHTYMYFEI